MDLQVSQFCSVSIEGKFELMKQFSDIMVQVRFYPILEGVGLRSTGVGVLASNLMAVGLIIGIPKKFPMIIFNEIYR